jgi:hypothetical protein
MSFCVSRHAGSHMLLNEYPGKTSLSFPSMSPIFSEHVPAPINSKNKAGEKLKNGMNGSRSFFPANQTYMRNPAKSLQPFNIPDATCSQHQHSLPLYLETTRISAQLWTPLLQPNSFNDIPGFHCWGMPRESGYVLLVWWLFTLDMRQPKWM